MEDGVCHPRALFSPCVWRRSFFLTTFEKSSANSPSWLWNGQLEKILWRQVVPTKEIEAVHATGKSRHFHAGVQMYAK